MYDLSIIIPVFNRRELIPSAIRSALAQTPLKTQVIVIDDGSTDGTSQVVEELFANQVELIRQKHAGGSVARNTGLQEARGTYINFLDSDDLLTPGALPKLCAALETMAVDVVYGDWRWVDSEGHDTLKKSKAVSDMVCALLGGWWSATISYVYKRTALQDLQWDTRLSRGQDFDFNLSAAIRGNKFGYAPIEVGSYRQHSGARVSAAPSADSYRSLLRALEKGIALLEATGGMTPARRQSAAEGLWRQVRPLLGDKEIYSSVSKKIDALVPDFRPSDSQWRGKVSRWIGWKNADRLVRLLRPA